MKTTINHTPIEEWEICEPDFDSYLIHTDKIDICTVFAQGDLSEEGKANAKFIMKACKNHYDLLEALQLVKEAYFDKADLNTSSHDELHLSVLTALKAIKKATE